MLLAAVLAAGSARADVEVRLTTGAVIRALRASRNGDRVDVVQDSGTMSLPASKVLSIRDCAAAAKPAPDRLNYAGGGEPEGAASARASGEQWQELRRIAPLVRSGDLRAAEAEARRALVESPGDASLTIALGEILLAQSRNSDAVATLRALPTAGLSDPLRRNHDLALSEALSRLQRVDEASAALASTPDDDEGRVAQARARLQPDLELSDRPLGSSPHFTLVAPPGTRDLQVDSQLAMLEKVHAALTSELGGAPRDRITVVLYPGTEFWEATGQGKNVLALFDGKMRIPSGRLSPPSPALLPEVRHEMTHAFVEALSGARADVRWHEGLAEHFEGSDAAPTVRALKASLKDAEAEWPPPVTHDTSHAFMEWFIARWGMAGVRDVLSGLASRGTIDASVRAVTGLGESELDAAWRRDLVAENR